jgi:Ca2+-binding RTX toxin-like protein
MFEPLENRVLFARIELVDGVLTLRGNAENNYLAVTTVPQTGDLSAQYGITAEIRKTYKTSKVKLIRMFGKGGDDTMLVFAQYNGTAPKAKMFGGAGNDGITGSTGKDTLVGGPGNDNCNGNQGNDLLKGNSGNDSLSGKEGNDTMIGGTGEDNMNGADGNDLFKARDDAFDWLTGGIGDDRALVDFTAEPFHVLNSLDDLGTDGEIEEVITG